jgi:ELWxxDGT repeat protein
MSTPRRIADIRPGIEGSYPDRLTAVGNTLYFRANDDIIGYELWKTDGTAAGTQLVADIRPGSRGSDPNILTAVGNTLYFTADDGTRGLELWRTDGTDAGTQLVADIRPGSLSSFPTELTAIGNTLYFTADDGTRGPELWKTDGTAAGTQLVADIRPGSVGSIPRQLTVIDNILYFTADDGGTNGRQLWRTYGTSTGTARITDITHLGGYYFHYPNNLTAVGNILYFSASENGSGTGLWKSDGTSTGTFQISEMPSAGSDPMQDPMYLTAVNNTLFFSARNGSTGRELWKSDGTRAGTTLVSDIRAGSLSSSPSFLKAVGDTLFFSALNDFWKSDGTSNGTQLVAEITPGPNGSSPGGFTEFKNKVFFQAGSFVNDGGPGRELWKSDGTSDGTTLVADIFPGGGSSSPFGFTVVGDTLFFSADDGSSGRELWALDITTPPPSPIFSVAPLSADKEEGIAASTPFTFRVTRSGDLAAESIARWMVTGFGNNPADADDFLNGLFPSGTVRFLAGQSARNITVLVAGDTAFEPDETFTVSLSDPAGASIDPAFSSAIGTIRNDDAPPLPTLAIAATDADKPEGFSGNTPLTFIVTRSGDTSTAISASWAVSGIGANPADAADFARGVLPSGTVRFSAGQTSRTITVNVRADRDQEPDERFRVTLSNPTGATITTASANGIIRNDDLIGTAANDTIIGTRRPEYIDGLAGQDTLTGGAGPDVFGFRFGQSRIRTPDRITDYRFGEDTIALLNAQRQLRPAPLAFSRAANNRTASTLADLAAAVFADADGRTAGDQPLAANAAALVRSTNAAIAGTYLLINDANSGRSLTADLMVNITGFSGKVPALGVRPVGTVFG